MRGRALLELAVDVELVVVAEATVVVVGSDELLVEAELEPPPAEVELLPLAEELEFEDDPCDLCECRLANGSTYWLSPAEPPPAASALAGA